MFSGPAAVIGNDMRNSFELALDHLDRKMAGLPVEIVYEDDRRGNFKCGNNHMRIQNFYLLDVVKDPDGNFVLKTMAKLREIA